MGCVVTGHDGRDAQSCCRDQFFELNVTLSPQAAERMRKISRDSMRQPLTILINGRQIATATVQSEVGGQFRIGVPRAIARDLLPTLID
jgi:preprotein translocase subunit SecD